MSDYKGVYTPGFRVTVRAHHFECFYRPVTVIPTGRWRYTIRHGYRKATWHQVPTSDALMVEVGYYEEQVVTVTRRSYWWNLWLREDVTEPHETWKKSWVDSDTLEIIITHKTQGEHDGVQAS